MEREEPEREALSGWLAKVGFPLRDTRPLPGDVSPRRYTRLTAANGGTAILASYPAELLAACERFVRTGQILAAAGVPVPRVLAADCARGWMLLEDLGELTLADLRQRPWSELGAWFADAAKLAACIAALPPAAVRDLSPPLDRALLTTELAQTRQAFLEPRGLVDELSMATLDAMDQLCGALAADPLLPCHRDFMARNLMPSPNGDRRLTVLDHQDLRLGPPAYDLASLLNDTLFPPPELEQRLVDELFPGAGGRLRYHRAAAQRTLKAVGSYAAFARRGFDRHVPLIGPTLRRFRRHFGSVPEGERLAPRLETAWAQVLG
jgi:N-acetylmuramate 1-kinase